MLPASITSVALACAFFAMLRFGAPRWSYLVLGVLPPALLLLASPNLRVYGYHGFIQAGIVYQILLGNLPPTSPLLAGLPGTYPWAGTLILAAVCTLTGISPFWAAAWITIASLAALLAVTYRIGLLATGDPEASLFGTTVALYAFTFTQSVPDSALKRGLSALLPFAFVEPRGAPILEKFNGCTAFPPGLALYAVALLMLLRLARRGAPEWRETGALAASLLALAFVYPFLFPPLALLCVVVGVLAWSTGGAGRRLAMVLAAVLALAGTSVLPYYLHLGAGRSGAVLQLVSLAGLPRQAGVIVVTLLPMSLLFVWARRAVQHRLRAQGRAATLLLVSGAINILLFAFVQAPLWSQYKFLLLGIFAFGIVGGIALRALRERAWPVALVVLSVLLLPFGLDSVHKARDWHDVPRVFQESGIALDHLDPAERDLDQWMRTSTDARAVFVDADLGVPVYGQRALYVAMPQQRAVKALTTRGGDGYTLDPRLILTAVDGYPEALVDRRLQTAARLLAGEAPTAAERADLSAAGSRAYLVLRHGRTRPAQRSPFPIVFENPAATIVELPR